jgi:phosphoglycerol transferase MdoB-like AlkP superfamily enzyme
MDSNILFTWILLNAFWLWYIIYWKKAQNVSTLISWFALTFIPYFVNNYTYLIIIWIILIITPFFIKINY